MLMFIGEWYLLMFKMYLEEFFKLKNNIIGF